MSRLHIATRGICNWRERLASPDRQWKREFSAFETAVSWEFAAKRQSSGLPEPIEEILRRDEYADAALIFCLGGAQGGHARRTSRIEVRCVGDSSHLEGDAVIDRRSQGT
jgi:hypothetical protein